MTKKVLFSLCAISLSFNLLSQVCKNRISFALGPSISVSNFADKDFVDKHSGFAKTGVNLHLCYKYLIINNYGFGLKLFVNSNKFDTYQIINELKNTTGEDWSSNSSYWSSRGLLLGLNSYFPYGEKFVVDYKILLGYINLHSPNIKITENNNSNIRIVMESKSASSFGYNLGLGLSYYFSSKWNLLVNGDYIGANFKFPDLSTTTIQGTCRHLIQFIAIMTPIYHQMII
jgi:opacity protein-like surface antigen